MQFKLRTALIFFALSAVAIGRYTNWRQANIGVQLNVLNSMNVSDVQVPKFINEYSSWSKVRQHDQDFPLWSEDFRLKQLQGDLSLYRRQFWDVDLQLLRTNKVELVALAKQTLWNENLDFKSLANAAWILDQTGDKKALPKILERLNQRLDRDSESRWKIFDVFPASKLIADARLVEELKSRVGEDSSFGRRGEHVLFKTGIDRQPLVNRKLQQAEEELGKATGKHSAIRWLLTNAPSVKVLELAEAYLFDSSNSMRWSNDYLARAVLISDFNSSSKLQDAANRIESRLVDLIRNLRKKSAPDGGHFAWQFWRQLVSHGTVISKELFLETLAMDELHFRHFSAVRALVRLGHASDCREFMEAAVMNLQSQKPVSHAGILDLHEACCGRQESIEVCTQLACDQMNLAAFEKLAEHFEATNDNSVSDLIVAKLFREGEGEYAVQALQLLEKIGDSRLSKLWGMLSSATTSDPLNRFYQHWHTNATTRADLVDWINKTLKPKKTVSIESVLTESKFFAKPEHYLWRIVHAGFPTRHKFAVAALAHSGSGDLASGVDIYFEELSSWIPKFAEVDSGELQVSSASSELLGTEGVIRLVVNNRLYEFTLSEPQENYENYYDTRAVVELLNTIAVRRRMKKRFFAYPTEWGKDICLVLFLEPAIAEELEQRFALSPCNALQ